MVGDGGDGGSVVAFAADDVEKILAHLGFVLVSVCRCHRDEVGVFCARVHARVSDLSRFAVVLSRHRNGDGFPVAMDVATDSASGGGPCSGRDDFCLSQASA